MAMRGSSENVRREPIPAPLSPSGYCRDGNLGGVWVRMIRNTVQAAVLRHFDSKIPAALGGWDEFKEASTAVRQESPQ